MSTDDTVREVEVDELAEAERYLREICDASPGFTDGRLARVMAEYDERGRERDAARADRDVLSLLLRGMTRRLWKHRMAFRQIRQGGAAREHRLGQERDAARAEVWQLRESIRILGENGAELSAELQRLRARDEAAKAAAQAWESPIGPAGSTFNARSIVEHQWPGLPGLLDALARAHGVDGQVERTPPELPSDEVERTSFRPFDQPAHENARGVTLRHIPTGIFVSSGEERTAVQNIQAAYPVLREAVAQYRARAHEEKDGGQDR